MNETNRLEFVNDQGIRLAARLEKSHLDRGVYALFAHCFTCSKDIAAATRISRALTKSGINVLRFDFTGLGNSDGDFANTNFSSNVSDLLSAAKYLDSNFEAPQLLIGHSLGGAAVLSAATELESVKAVAVIGAPADPEHVTHHMDAEKKEIEEKGEAMVDLAGRKFKIKKQFLEDLSNQNSKNTISTLKKALIVFHSPQDQVVGIDNAKQIYMAAKHPKSFISLNGADHLLSKAADSEYVALVLAAWADRYIEYKQTPSVPNVVVEGNKGLTQKISSGTHTLIADEPPNLGGKDLGPTPYDYLLSSLGACTSMTLQMYARRKKWPLENVKVTLEHKKIHAEDCEDCETQSGKIDVISRRIEIQGDLDETQRERLLEIADKCPVHKTLHGEVKVETVLG